MVLTSASSVVLQKWLEAAKPPKWLWKTIAAIVLGGQVATRILKGECVTPATAAGATCVCITIWHVCPQVSGGRAG